MAHMVHASTQGPPAVAAERLQLSGQSFTTGKLALTCDEKAYTISII
jgi:hypothetical protein